MVSSCASLYDDAHTCYLYLIMVWFVIYTITGSFATNLRPTLTGRLVTKSARVILARDSTSHSHTSVLHAMNLDYSSITSLP